MPATIEQEATQLATGGVDTIFQKTDAKVYQLEIDLGNMQAGDTLVVNIDVKVLSAGSFINLYTETFNDAQVAPDIIQLSRPVPSPHEVRVTIEQTAGTNRSYDWQANSIASVTVEATGTIALDGTEQTLATITSNRTMVLLTDHTNQVGGDTVVLRAKTRARQSGTDRVAFEATLVGALSAPDIAQISIPVVAPDQWVGTIEKTLGANHNVPYSAISVAAA